MLISSTSTASLGKFDNKIEGEPKVRGMKRKFESVVSMGWDGEKRAAMEVLAGVGKGKGSRSGGAKREEEGGLNVRKAVRFQAREDRARGDGGGARGRGGGRGRGRGMKK